MNRLRRFMLNGILMAAVALVMRTVTVTFNVYISNKIGSVAMGLFSLIGSVYGFALTFATSGINLASTRIIAEAIGDTADTKGIPPRSRAAVNCILRRCVVYALFFGSLASIVLWCFAEKIGLYALKDIRTVSSLKVLALTLIPISLSSLLSGYFSAVRHAYKNALTGVFSQGVKIYASIMLIAAIGAKDTESACLSVVLGGAVAEFASFMIGLILFLLGNKRGQDKVNTATKKKATRDLLSNALPVAFSAYMRSALVTVEHILIPIGLEKSGSSRDASLSAYGIVGSMAFPLVLFPSAISASFAGLLIPEVAESVSVGDTRRLKGIVSTVLETVLIFSIGCAGVIMSFSLELGSALYTEAPEAGKYILMISPLIPVMYLDTAVDSMLKGMGEQVYTMWVNIIDATVSVILVATLLPRMGIMGYIITVYFTEILNATLSITRLLVKSRVKTHIFLWVGRPLLCIIAAAKLTHFLTERTVLGGVWLHISLTSALYVLFMLLCGGIKPRVVADRVRYIFTHK